MRKHTKIYMDYLGLNTSDFIPCEICGSKANDINHINARGMGGSKTKDNIDNLMAVCRTGHIKFGDIKELKQGLVKIHQDFISNRKPAFNIPCSEINKDNILSLT